jgi:hypothetical protein
MRRMSERKPMPFAAAAKRVSHSVAPTRILIKSASAGWRTFVSSDAGKDDDVLLASLKPILVAQRVRKRRLDTIQGRRSAARTIVLMSMAL